MKLFRRARLHAKLCKFMNDLGEHRFTSREEMFSCILSLLEEAEELEDSSYNVIQRLITII